MSVEQLGDPGEFEQDGADTKIFPVFLVLDTSWSMQGDRIEAAEEMTPAILDEVLADTSIKDKVRLEVIGFSNEARVLLPFAQPTSTTAPPGLVAEGGTIYSAAFRLLRTEIENAVRMLRQDGFKVLRPTVFFITDGEPTDDESERDAAFAELTDQGFKANPNIFMFGVGEAQQEILTRYTARKGIAAKSKGDAADGLRKLIPAITASVVQTAGDGDGGVEFPEDELDDDDFEIYG